MDMYSQKSKSIPQKTVIVILEIVLLWLSYWIMFGNGGYIMAHKLGIINQAAFTTRRAIIFAFSIMVFFRIGLMMFVFLKRRIPWMESIDIPFAFALYYIGFPLFALSTHQKIDAIDYIGIGIFITGSCINTFSELLRYKWKQNPEHKGKLYTEGLFKYSMHVNYFGDVLWVSAYAILTRNWYSVIIPIFLLCFFIFYNIPKLDAHLKTRYADEYPEYARRTKKLIPFIY